MKVTLGATATANCRGVPRNGEPCLASLRRVCCLVKPVEASEVHRIRAAYILQSVWSSGQTSWLQTQRSPVRFPMLPDFLRSSGSGTWSTQPL
jgi:hypothetical protein